MQIVLCLILASFAVHVAGEAYPTTKLQGMPGFAKKGGTTGGSAGPVVMVSNVADLKKFISDAVAQTLVINANLDSPNKEMIFLGSNKSIIGSWKSNVIRNIYLHTARNSSNIIFQNLVFRHDPKNTHNEDTQINLEFGEKYWIDHCTFDGEKINLNDLGKLLKISSVNFVSVSHCKFLHHNYGLILGFPQDVAVSAPNKDLPQLTIMFNFFDDINARAPGLMRHGKFHVYNNYIHNCRLGFTVGFQSKIYSENNFFSELPAHSSAIDDKGNGFFIDKGSSMAVPKVHKFRPHTWIPSSQYPYKLQTPEYAQKFCTTSSGAQTAKLEFADGIL